MADIAIASTLLNKLIGKMIEEVYLFHEVEDRVWSLLCMLKRLRPSVMEVERKKSIEMKGLMWEFIEIVYEAHNAIDSYVFITTTNREAEGISASSKDVDLKAADDELRSQIECIKLRLKIWHKCCLTSTTASSSSVVEKVDKDGMVEVGLLENEVTMMVEQLLKDKDPRLDVIPIVGPGGVGKTTLARGIYTHPTIVENFPCRAWIYAYEQLPLKELLQEIIKQVSHSPPTTAEDKDHQREKMILGDLAIQTYKQLKTCGRYLLVFDDVCRTQFWADINMIFPGINKLGGGGGGGGRIIFTTRYDEVALSARPRRPPFYLPPVHMNKEESLALFSTKVASSSRDKASTSSTTGRVRPPTPDHSPLKEWVDFCGKLPHAIVALAAEYHQRQKSSPADPNYEARLYLGLIYYNLPQYLKPCFLYLGVLGGSCRFKQLKELIVAESLAVPPPSRTKTTRSQNTAAEVVKDDDDGDDILASAAEEYVNELINRKLVKVVSNRWDGSVDEIRISSTEWIAFCRDKAREVNFRQLCSYESETTTFPDQLELNILQLCFHTAGNTATTSSPSKACSFFILEDTTTLSISKRGFGGRHWDFLLKTNYFSHLRVLDLFGVYLTDDIPSEISRLIHLRYLRLNFNIDGLIKLPQSICNLCNLQFLQINYDYYNTRFNELEWFWEMRQLKQLLFGTNCSFILPQPPPDDHDQDDEDYLEAATGGGGSSSSNTAAGGGVGGQGLVTLTGGPVVLHNLQRLKHVDVSCCTKQVLSRMPNLVTLGVKGKIEQRHYDNELSNSLPLLRRLQKLRLGGGYYGNRMTLPRRWEVLFPPNITHLTFKRTFLGDHMGILGKLPNLKVLKLAEYAVFGDVLDVGCTAAGGVTTTTTTNNEEEEGGCYDGGFRQLKCLKLDDLRIRRWNMPVGAMPSLEILVIRDCPKLEGLPSEALQNIHTLRELALEKVKDYSDPSQEEAALRTQEALEAAAVAIQECVGKDRLQLRFIKKPSIYFGGVRVATDAVTQSG